MSKLSLKGEKAAKNFAKNMKFLEEHMITLQENMVEFEKVYLKPMSKNINEIRQQICKKEK